MADESPDRAVVMATGGWGSSIVIVKLGYLDPELYAMPKCRTMALTPGGNYDQT